MFRAAFIAAVTTAFFILLCSGCAEQQREPFTTVSLFDLLDADEPPGPWRRAALPGIDPVWFAEAEGLAVKQDGVLQPASELANMDLAAIRTLIRNGSLIQTAELSTLSLTVDLQAGESVAVSLQYSGRNLPGEAMVRLLRDGQIQDESAGGWLELGFQLAIPVGPVGADRIEIIHRQEPGAPLRLLAVDVLVVDAPDPECREATRACHFLRLGSGDTSLLFHGAAESRLVRVSRFGMTARCAVLLPGDSLEFDLPPGGSDGRLAFHYLRPPGDVRSATWLKLERESGGAWSALTCWKGDSLPAGEWRRQTADLFRRDRQADRIRLTHAGTHGVIGIAEPVLLPAARRAPDAPNLVLVALDTLRADRLGCYGYRQRPTSERLDRAMEEWGFALFRRAYSASPWTVPATAKFMSSRYLDFHGERRIPESTTMLAELLREKGYYCAAFTGGGMVAVPGMEQGFHEYRWSSGFGKVEGSFPQAGQWLRQWDGGPFFLFVHTYETHRPYTRDTFCRGLPRGRLGDLTAGDKLLNREVSTVTALTAEERTCVQAAYDSGVYHATEATADLLDTLDETGQQRNTVVVILSDHGEELWDRHQLFGAHGHSLHGEMLDVPLLIHCPETAGRGLVAVEEPVSTVDLPPTAADLLGLSWEGGADGVSLRPLLVGGGINRTIPILADLQRARLHPEILAQACVIEGGVKYIEPLVSAAAGKGPLSGVVPAAVPGLFRLSTDPGEAKNLAAFDPELTVRMRELLRRAMAGALQPGVASEATEAPGDSRLSDELEEQLQALGYLD